MGHSVTGALISGIRMDGQKTFASVPGLKMDWDSARRLVLSGGVNVVSWTDLISGIPLTNSGVPNVTKSGDYVVVDGNALINNSFPSIGLNNFYNASPRGIYLLGEIGGAGATRAIVQFLNPAGTITAYYRTANSGGASRLGFTNMGTPTFLGTVNLVPEVKSCFVYRFGENNTTSNVALYQGNTAVGFNTRNYTSAPNALGNCVRMRIIAPSGFPLRIQRLLLYDWNGFNQSQVIAFHNEVKSIMNTMYGSIF